LPLAKKSLGPLEVQAAAKVCEDSLAWAVKTVLLDYGDGIADHERDHLIAWLGQILGVISEPASVLLVTDDPSLLVQRKDELIRALSRDPRFDPATFGITIGDEFVRVDEREIIRLFVEEVPGRLRDVARRADSPLHELVTTELLDDVRRQLVDVREILDSSYPKTISPQDAVAQAQGLTRATTLRRLSNEQVRREALGIPAIDAASDVESAATREWVRFKEDADWRDRIAKALEALREGLKQLGVGDSDVSTLLPVIDSNLPYSVVHGAVAQVEFNTVHRLLNSRLREQTGSSESGRSLSAVGRRLRDQLAWLERQRDIPLFHTTFTLVGGIGSGKSHILTAIACRSRDDGDFVLALNPYKGEGLEAALIRQSQDLFGVAFADLAALARFLMDHAPTSRLIVLIDDVDGLFAPSSRPASELREFLDACSLGRAFTVALTASDIHVERLVESEDPRFWVRYGAVDSRHPPSTSTGWLDLDELNLEQGLGLEILRRLAPHEAEDIDAVASDTVTFTAESKLLSNPLAALLRASKFIGAAAPGRTPITDINEVTFARSYGDVALRRVCRDADERQRAERAVTACARAWASGASFHLPIAAVTGDSEADLSRRDVVMLQSASLLERAWLGDPELDVDLAEVVSPRMTPYWGYRIARPLIADHPDATALFRASKAWRGSYTQEEDPLGESICQFLLLLSDDGTEVVHTGLWTSWLAGHRQLSSPLLLAAAAASPAAQSLVAKALPDLLSHATKRRLFLLTRFVSRANLPHWGADERIGALHAYYPGLGRVGLSMYVRSALRTILEQPGLVHSDNYLATLTKLVDSEYADAHLVAATYAVRAGRAAFGGDADEWLRSLFRFFQRTAPPPVPRRNAPAGRTRKAVAARRLDIGGTFLAALAHEAIVQVRDSEEMNGYRRLVDSSWHAATRRRIHRDLAKFMRDDLNATFGAGYQRGRDSFRRQYLEFVSELAGGSATNHPRLEQREMALFLIRHSVPTRGERAIKVDEAFLPTLRLLASDGDLLKRADPYATPLMQANGVPLPPVSGSRGRSPRAH